MKVNLDEKCLTILEKLNDGKSYSDQALFVAARCSECGPVRYKGLEKRINEMREAGLISYFPTSELPIPHIPGNIITSFGIDVLKILKAKD